MTNLLGRLTGLLSFERNLGISRFAAFVSIGLARYGVSIIIGCLF